MLCKAAGVVRGTRRGTTEADNYVRCGAGGVVHGDVIVDVGVGVGADVAVGVDAEVDVDGVDADVVGIPRCCWVVLCCPQRSCWESGDGCAAEALESLVVPAAVPTGTGIVPSVELLGSFVGLAVVPLESRQILATQKINGRFFDVFGLWRSFPCPGTVKNI